MSSFGDTVRILSTPETKAKGVDGKVGEVSGVTVPSLTGIEIIGDTEKDCGISVLVHETRELVWLNPDLVVQLEHGEAIHIEAGNFQGTRDSNGSWQVSEQLPQKKWWEFWK